MKVNYLCHQGKRSIPERETSNILKKERRWGERELNFPGWASRNEQGESVLALFWFPTERHEDCCQIIKECWAGLWNGRSQKENILCHHSSMTHPFPNIFSFERLVLFPLKVWSGGPFFLPNSCSALFWTLEKRDPVSCPLFLGCSLWSHPLLGLTVSISASGSLTSAWITFLFHSY